MRGPTPKNPAERRRRNKVPGETIVEVNGSAVAPELPPDLHPLAVAWYASLATSHQAGFYQASDWAAAVYLAAVITKTLEAPKLTSAMVAAVMHGMSDLLCTEASRRRVGLHTARKEPEPTVSTGEAASYEYRRRLRLLAQDEAPDPRRVLRDGA